MQSYKSYYMVSPQTVFTYPFSPCKATNITTRCPRKQSLLILFTVQSYKSYYMVSPQTVLTYPFHHAKLQILHGFTTNSGEGILCTYTSTYILCSKSFSFHMILLVVTIMAWTSWYNLYHSFVHQRCKATNLTIYMVSPQTVFTYPFHHAKLQILLHGVTTNSLHLSFSPCKATNLTTWCHRKQSLLILFTMQSYKSYYMVSPQTVFTYPFHHAKLQILLHGVTTNSLYLSFSPCKATNLTTWCHHKQSWRILFIMQSYKSYMVSPQTVVREFCALIQALIYFAVNHSVSIWFCLL